MLAASAAACASRQPLPPGNELEYPEGAEPSGGARNFEKAPSNEAELSAAFDPTPPPAPKPTAPAPAAPPPRDEREEARAAFRTVLADVRRLVTARSPEAEAAVEQLVARAESLEPSAQQEAHALAFQEAMGRKATSSARRSAEAWLLSCGPDRPDRCRAKALSALASVARPRAQELRTADRCLRQAEAAGRSGAAVPPCLDEAITTYRRMRDKLMVARGQLARAMATVRGDAGKLAEGIAQLRRAERACEEERCVDVRQRALKSLSVAHQRQNDLPNAARAALQAMSVGAQRLPEERRLYARTADVDRLCAQLDAREGAGSCRKLERAELGSYTFRDFSQERARGGTLAPERVKQVNEHFAVAMQECLAAEAERLVPPAMVRYQIRWTITPDGRVDQVHLDRRDQDSGPFAQCLRKQFTVWRYPRYDGELQHVEQTFTLSARERRTWTGGEAHR